MPLSLEIVIFLLEERPKGSNYSSKKILFRDFLTLTLDEAIEAGMLAK
jgi:hypothetical protein